MLTTNMIYTLDGTHTGNLADWWPHCLCFDGKRPLPGYCFEWLDQKTHLALLAQIEEVLAQPGVGITFHLAGDICGDIVWRVRRENGGSAVGVAADYSLPLRRMLPFMSPVRAWRFQQDEADAMLARVQARFDPH